MPRSTSCAPGCRAPKHPPVAEVVVVADEFLVPTNRGGRVETAGNVRSIAAHHHVRLLVPRDPWTTPSDEAAHRTALPVETHFFDRPSRVRSSLARPWLPYHAATRLPSVRELDRLTAALAGTPADLIVAAHDFMAPAASALSPRLGGAPIIIRSHNDEPRYFAAMSAAATSLPLRVFHRGEAARSRSLRRRIVRTSHTIAVLSPDDAAGYAPAPVTLVPPALASATAQAAARLGGRNELLFVGALDARLSAEGLEWFRLDVLPAVVAAAPGTRLRVVGRGADPELAARLHADPAVQFDGERDSLEPAFADARVFVNPSLGGSGVNIKMGGPAQRGIPIVTTPSGARGLDPLRAGLAINSDATAFAAATVALLTDDRLWHERATSLATAFAAVYSQSAIDAAWNALITDVAE